MIFRGEYKMYIKLYKCTQSIFLLITFTLFAISTDYSQTNSTVAVLTKTIQDVTRKSEGTSEWMKAKKGDPLVSGDFVRTGEKSFAIVKFTDNSMLRVREQSEVQIKGGIEGNAFSKEINIQRGGFGFDIKKQQNERFIFTSPTSVASIRGTKGKMSSGPTGDTLTVTEGAVNLRSKSSNKEVDVSSGSIGFSNADGVISSRTATEEELSDADAAATNGIENELNFELRDPQGNKKNLKIKYK
jgi:hypothetical protein